MSPKKVPQVSVMKKDPEASPQQTLKTACAQITSTGMMCC